jgi:hypothetical protein
MFPRENHFFLLIDLFPTETALEGIGKYIRLFLALQSPFLVVQIQARSKQAIADPPSRNGRCTTRVAKWRNMNHKCKA